MNPRVAEVRIRRMSPADLERVTAIAQSLKDAPQWPVSAYQVAVNAAMNPEITPRRIALVAEGTETSSVLGFLVAGLLPPQGELETIAVAAANQRRGVARFLFSRLVEELEEAEVREVILEVRSSNRAALEFYRAHGFVETGRRPRYYSDPVEDAVLLGLWLA